jgi:uncharacterized repeat protein (TIGR03803 family)
VKQLSFAKISCALFAICLAIAINSSAQTPTVLYNFVNSSPTAPLVQGADGNFYGTMAGGNIGFEGNVYKLTPSGTYTSLFDFCSDGCSDGQFPFGPLLLATNGYFYGTTEEGGTALEGNVYKITASGTETSIYSFCTTPSCSDGASPSGPLIQVGTGDIYGVTPGTIFRISLGGTLTTFYNFCPIPSYCNSNSPFYPSGLLLGKDGNFYGVAGSGGTSTDGIVFKLTPSGKLTTLHNFDGTDGQNPVGPLVQAANGELYGVTFAGGTGTASECEEIGSCGTIFRISTSGTFTTLHNFDGTDGSNPYAPLILATDGNLYGTTGFGGNNASDAGTIFEITPAGAFTSVYDFCSQTYCLDGANSRTPLFQATNGTIYGTTGQGGTQTNGVFFSLSSLSPFVETIPSLGKVATKVTILGNGLTGATSVTFNGVSAAFTVVSDTEITTTVPYRRDHGGGASVHSNSHARQQRGVHSERIS